MGNLAGRVAIVSGSGRGIGREIALKLAAEGAAVVVNDLDADVALQTEQDIKAAGGQAVSCVGSVSEDGFAERFVNTATESFGGLDIIVNNAGYTWDSVIQKMTDEQWDTILDVNLKAPFRILRAAQPYIKTHPTDYHRKVVNISSTSGFYGNAQYDPAEAADMRPSSNCPSVTAGFTWHPEIGPIVYTSSSSVRPNARATKPPPILLPEKTAVPTPPRTSTKVPIASATYFFTSPTC